MFCRPDPENWQVFMQIQDPPPLNTPSGNRQIPQAWGVVSPCSWSTDRGRAARDVGPPGCSLKDPGVLLKEPGALLKDPGVLSKDPGVLLKDPGVPYKDRGVLMAVWLDLGS